MILVPVKNMLIGSLVYKLKPTCEKSESQWAGPSIITQKFGPLVYKIRNRNKIENIHHDRLKPFLSADAQVGWRKQTHLNTLALSTNKIMF